MDMIIAHRNEDKSETLLFYRYDYDNATFIQDLTLPKFKTYGKGSYIKNLIANDINDDGFLDLIVTIYNTYSSKILIEIHLYDPVEINFNEAFKIDTSGVFIGDFDGDRLYVKFI